MNPFERAARAEKVERLTRAIDQTAAEFGIPRKNVAAQLAQFGSTEWSEIASRLGIRAPSPKTVRAVIARYS